MICPLLVIAYKDEEELGECQEKNCAWWREEVFGGCCAILEIAEHAGRI